MAVVTWRCDHKLMHLFVLRRITSPAHPTMTDTFREKKKEQSAALIRDHKPGFYWAERCFKINQTRLINLFFFDSFLCLPLTKWNVNVNEKPKKAAAPRFFCYPVNSNLIIRNWTRSTRVVRPRPLNLYFSLPCLILQLIIQLILSSHYNKKE